MIVKGQFEKNGKKIVYEVSWVLRYGDYELDEIMRVEVVGDNQFYEDNTQQVDDWVIENAYENPPVEEEQEETYQQFCERRAEEQYEAMQIERHFA